MVVIDLHSSTVLIDVMELALSAVVRPANCSVVTTLLNKRMAVASDSPCMPLVRSRIGGYVDVDGSDNRAPNGVVRALGSNDDGGGGGGGAGGIETEVGV